MPFPPVRRVSRVYKTRPLTRAGDPVGFPGAPEVTSLNRRNFGIKSPLDYSVFSASAAAVLLALYEGRN